jgi:RNA polymerase sigma factor (sigma-70 family)
VDDVMQEVRLKICGCQKLMNGQVQFPKSFVREIAKNCALDQKTRNDRRRSKEVSESDLPPPSPIVGDAFNALEQFGKHCDDLKTVELKISALQVGQSGVLTPRQKEILQCLLDGLSIGEIAKALKMKPANVRQHLCKTRPKLDGFIRRSS